MMLAELAMEAGLPDGVLNIVHGTNVSFHLNNFNKFQFLNQHISFILFYLSFFISFGAICMSVSEKWKFDSSFVVVLLLLIQYENMNQMEHVMRYSCKVL